jgi:hypothetical protein
MDSPKFGIDRRLPREEAARVSALGRGRLFSNKLLSKMALLFTFLNLNWTMRSETLALGLYHSLSDGLLKGRLRRLVRSSIDLCLFGERPAMTQRAEPRCGKRNLAQVHMYITQRI